MNIAPQTVVSLQYVLKNAAGEVLDQCDQEQPHCYLHGANNLISGVEEALSGSEAGAAMEVVVSPEKGYGPRDDELVLAVPRSELPEGDLNVGMQFEIRQGEGVGVVTVTGIEGEEVTLDGNHPLAGETLHFDLKVLEVRAATEEELEHGHVHGPGGHHH
jgi:FKBP-type peptidyl-prolyl cis-trans isomerase SlyD